MTNEEIKNKFMDIFAFEGFSSNVLTLRKAEEGEIISYEKQEDIISSMVKTENSMFSQSTGKDRIFPPEFELIGTGTIIEEAIKDFIRKDTMLCIELMFMAAAVNNQITPIPHVLDFKGILEETQMGVEQHRLITDKFIMGRDMLSNMKGIKAFDCNNDDELIGIYGSIWGVNIFIEPWFLQHSIFAVTEGKYLGERVIRDISYDNNILTVKGTMCIINTRAISLGIGKRYTKIELDHDKINELQLTWKTTSPKGIEIITQKEEGI